MSITQTKQNKITRTAQVFLQKNPQYFRNYQFRFDVIIVDQHMGIHWLQDAFREE